MKKSLLYLVLLFCSFLGQAQSSSNEKTEAKSVANASLSQKYAPKLLEAYQDNAKTKIEELFAYFQMLTDASLTDEYKKEIVKSIQYAFKNQNSEVIDFTSATRDKILLNDFIEKLLISEPILFKMSNTWQNGGENPLSWKIGYSVTKTKSGVKEEIKINQVVFLFEALKPFGNTNKNVTVTFLGKME